MDEVNTDDFMNGALISWFKSCLTPPDRITAYTSLFDCRVLYNVLLQIKAESQIEPIDIGHLKGDSLCKARTRNFESLIQNVKLLIEKDLGKKMLICPDSFTLGFHPTSANGLEEIKLLMKLLIWAAVQCSKKEIFLERIKKMDAKTQNQIGEFIKEVTDCLVVSENSVHLISPATMYKHLLRASKERENMYVKWSEAVNSSSEELDKIKLELQSTCTQLKAAETSAGNLLKENSNLKDMISTLKKQLNCLPAELGFSSPENRLKLMQRNSITSTPNRNQQHAETKTQLSSDLIGTQCNFLVPPVPGRRSCASDSSRHSWNVLQTGPNSSNTSLGYNSRDSFSIPETQQFPERAFMNKSCDQTIADSDVGANDMLNSRNESASDNSDYCIPETQEVFVLPSSQMRKNKFTEHAKNNDNLPSNMIAEEDEDAANTIGGSQIRICTQDFNDVDLFGDDSDSNDVIADMPGSIVIPRIKHDAVLLDEAGKLMQNCAKSGDDTDIMSTLQWSEPGSKSSTFHKESSQREEACTPDLFDLPELAQQNAKDTITCNVSINAESNSQSSGPNIDDNTAVFAFEAPSTSLNLPAPAKPKIIVLPPFEDDDDLLPTQVFTTKPAVDKDAIKCSPVLLTLSDKENMQPAAATTLEDAMQTTQVFGASNSPATNPLVGSSKEDEQMTPHTGDAAVDAVEPATSSNINLASVIKVAENQEEDEDDLLPTQVFSHIIPIPSTKNSVKPCTSKFLSSTLQTKSEAGVKNALNFFAKQQEEHTPQKQSTVDFLKPLGALSKKSTLSNASMSESPDIDMLLCTPQIIAENFVQPDLATKNNLLAKQKTLFGDDSDDESDVLKLINVPRVSHAFDKLLPHLKKQNPSPKREEVEAKLHQYNRSFGQSDDSKSEKQKAVSKRSTARTRDERHTARDNNREKVTETVPKPDRKESVTRKTRKTNKLVESAATSTIPTEDARQTRKRQNVEPSTSKTKAKKSRSGKPTKVEQVEQPAEKRANKKSSKANSNVDQVVIAAKRITRSGSQSSNKEKPIEFPARRKTRLQSRVEEVVNKQKSIRNEQKEDSESVTSECSRARSCSTTTLDGSNTSKASMSTTASTKPANLSHNNKVLKVSMTMVNTEIFQNLAENSSGIWTVANEPTESDVLIMDKGNRTFKFLIAMARGIPIVKSSWLEKVNKNRGIVNFSEHCYADKDFEKRHKFSLLKSIELARKQKIFSDFHFLMTTNIRPQRNELEEIIKCAGGTVHTDVPTWRDNQKLYLVSSKADQKLWHKYRRLNNNMRIISSEGVMAAVMRQNVKPLDTNLLS